MKRVGVIGILCLAGLLAFSCCINVPPAAQPTEAVHSTAESITPLPTQELLLIATPRAAIDMSQFRIQIDERICSLKEVEFYGMYVFQADCPEEIFLAQAQTVTVTLLPTDGQVFPVSPIPEQEAIFGALEPPFEYGEFIFSDQANTAVFAIPMLKFSGEPILCGFSIPMQGVDVYIVVSGLTSRAF